MVVFTCQNCGDSLKKTAVDKHYNISKCRYKRPNLTCVDCLKDFFDQDYSTHTECMTEAERYSAKGTVFKEKKGKATQLQYVNMIHNLLNSKDLTNNQRKLLDVVSNYNNVPRKEAKFVNFVRTSIDKKATLTEVKNLFKLLQEAWANEQQTTASASTLLGSSENTGDEPNVNDQVCDDPSNVKHNETFENNQLLEEVEERRTKNNASIDESKENNPKMSKKELKKQKKKQIYLSELENEEKNHGNKVENNIMVYKETVSERSETSNKKTKKSKLKPDNTNSHENGLNQKIDAVEVSFTEETVSKKQKKRKIVDVIPEIAEKKNKLDCFAGGEEDAQKTFNWAEVILKVLKSRPDHELSLKRLSKKVVNEYQTVKPDHHTYEQLLAKFNKKIKKISGVRVLKDKAKLIE